MKKLLIKLTAKLLYFLGTKFECDFNHNEKNDVLELADMLAMKLENKGE